MNTPTNDTGQPDIPASERAATSLRTAIADGRYRAGTWLPSERVLSDQIGVGRPAVREALAALQREGLVERLPGGRPRVAPWAADPDAQVSPARKARCVVAAVIPQPPSYTIAHAIQGGLSRALSRTHPRMGLLVYDTYLAGGGEASHGLHPEIEALQRAEAEGVAGIAIWGCGAKGAEEALLRLQRSGVSVVFVDHRPTSLAFDFVGVENRSGMREAVGHLVGLGHRRIGYLSHPERQSTIVEREEGFKEALHTHGLYLDPALLFRGGRSFEVRAAEALARFMALPTPPTAVIAFNDLHAFDLIRSAGEKGLQVPTDLSVVGFDDAEQFSPQPSVLTTVRQPFREIGYRAGDLLLRRMDTVAPIGESRVHIMLAPTLTVRTTTAKPPIR
jgi:DNA-binding LacI/PurR family transcriptional regulator/DNA-binding transcriptional regulator YhcF (GntR family)